MARPARNKKTVNYSYFQNDDDEDFACVKAPPSKRSRPSVKEAEAELERSKNAASKSSSQETGSRPTGCKERTSLDVKLYERDLEAALTLSLLQTAETGEKQLSNDQGDKNQPLCQDPSVLRSNCSVDGNCLGLDDITDELASPRGSSRQMKAASAATEQQRRVDKQETDDGGDDDYQPHNTPDSESDADFSGQDESDDKEFTVKKVERKKLSKKEKVAPAQGSNKEKKPSKARAPSTGTPNICRSPAVSRPASALKSPPATPPVSKPAVSVSPAGGRLPKWTPPGQVGRSPSSSQSASLKSPGQGLRLGLSRMARVKPLHPNAAAH